MPDFTPEQQKVLDSLQAILEKADEWSCRFGWAAKYTPDSSARHLREITTAFCVFRESIKDALLQTKSVFYNGQDNLPEDVEGPGR